MAIPTTAWVDQALAEKELMLSLRMQRNRKWATRMSLLSAVVALSVPVMLGLQVSPASAVRLKNAALVAAALASLLQATDALFGWKGLWVRYTEAHAGIRSIQTRFAFEKILQDGEVPESVLRDTIREMDALLTHPSRQWVQLRQDTEAGPDA